MTNKDDDYPRLINLLSYSIWKMWSEFLAHNYDGKLERPFRMIANIYKVVSNEQAFLHGTNRNTDPSKGPNMGNVGNTNL
jgi:hypothetical protein